MNISGWISILFNEDTVVVWGDSPVLRMVILVWEVFLVVREETIKLYALLEVLNSLDASNVLKKIEVAIAVDASSDKSMPVNALELDVGVILLEFEVDGETEVNIWSLDCVHIFTGHLKLVEIEVLWEHLHI